MSSVGADIVIEVVDVVFAGERILELSAGDIFVQAVVQRRIVDGDAGVVVIAQVKNLEVVLRCFVGGRVDEIVVGDGDPAVAEDRQAVERLGGRVVD